MKKALMTLALAAFAFAANAQFVLGGNVGINHEGRSVGDYSQDASTNVSIMPKIGYWLNDKMQVGMQFGMDYTYFRNYDGDDNNDHYFSETQTEWNFSPYFRYNLAAWKNFTVFCEAQLGIGISPKRSWKRTNPEESGEGSTNAFSLGFAVVPGLNYALSEHFSLDLYINLLGLAYNYSNTTQTSGTTETHYYGHSWGLMADMNAQDINSHLSNFSIGFNYSF